MARTDWLVIESNQYAYVYVLKHGNLRTRTRMRTCTYSVCDVSRSDRLIIKYNQLSTKPVFLFLLLYNKSQTSNSTMSKSTLSNSTELIHYSIPPNSLQTCVCLCCCGPNRSRSVRVSAACAHISSSHGQSFGRQYWSISNYQFPAAASHVFSFQRPPLARHRPHCRAPHACAGAV